MEKACLWSIKKENDSQKGGGNSRCYCSDIVDNMQLKGTTRISWTTSSDVCGALIHEVHAPGLDS